jgi:hypothetical protein
VRASSEREVGVSLAFMPNPLPDSISDQLRDPTTALAAAVVIASHHPGILQWVVGFATPPAERPRSGGRRRPRLAKRETDDQALVKAMRSNPDGSIGDWSQTIHKSRTSTVSALHPLRDAGLAQSAEGRWQLTEEPTPREPPAK